MFLTVLYLMIAVFLASVVWCLYGLRWESQKLAKYLKKKKEDELESSELS